MFLNHSRSIVRFKKLPVTPDIVANQLIERLNPRIDAELRLRFPVPDSDKYNSQNAIGLDVDEA